jgi:hypothetical protein
MLSLEGKPPPPCYSLDRRKQAAQTATTSAKTKETSSQRGTNPRSLSSVYWFFAKPKLDIRTIFLYPEGAAASPRFAGAHQE